MTFDFDEESVITIDSEYAGQRLDKLMSLAFPEISRSKAQELIDSGLVFVNGKEKNKNYKPAAGDEVSFTVPAPREMNILAQNIPLDIIYEDNDLLVVNKPKGMVVHPANGNYENTLVNALMYHCKGSLSGVNGVIRPGIVHRIDKDTAGLLLVAKNDRAHISLSEQIKAHSVDRIYYAVIKGYLKEESGVIDAPIGRNTADRKKMCVTQKNSKTALTHYEVVERLCGYSLIKCRLETGRTHQIRVHMAYLGHPLAGDTVYGSPKDNPQLCGQCLFAAQIGFNHPVTNERMLFKAPFPKWFEEFVKSVSATG